MASRKPARARVRWASGTHWLNSRMIPGKNPASATPNSRRSPLNWAGVVMNAIKAAITPQVSMIRLIQRRAPTRSRIRLLGTSNTT